MIFNRHGLPPNTYMAIYQWNGPTATPAVRIKPKTRQHPLKHETRVVFVYPDGSLAPFTSVPASVSTVWKTDPDEGVAEVGVDTTYRHDLEQHPQDVVSGPRDALFADIIETTRRWGAKMAAAEATRKRAQFPGDSCDCKWLCSCVQNSY